MSLAERVAVVEACRYVPRTSGISTTGLIQRVIDAKAAGSLS